MYVFISYSSKDQIFARSLEESLTLLSVPVFLDERQIKIGDSITETVFSALDRATHILYIVSRNSLRSRWVQEELAVAKMRQLSDRGSKIFPLLIEDADLPPSMTHIKYADFRNWRFRESYLETLGKLVEAMGVQPIEAATSTEMNAFAEHLNDLVRIKEFSDTVAQTYFQLERIWHFILGEDKGHAIRNWLKETADKTCNFDSFVSASNAIRRSLSSLSGAGGERWNKLRSQLTHVTGDFRSLHQLQDDGVYFGRILEAEVNARDLSAAVFSILSEMSFFSGARRRMASNTPSAADGKAAAEGPQ